MFEVESYAEISQTGPTTDHLLFGKTAAMGDLQLDRLSQLELSAALGKMPNAKPSEFARPGWEIAVRDCVGQHVLLQFPDVDCAHTFLNI